MVGGAGGDGPPGGQGAPKPHENRQGSEEQREDGESRSAGGQDVPPGEQNEGECQMPV